MRVFMQKLLLGGSVAALTIASLAAAQAQSTTDSDVETVTVTGSRISIQGYEAPTPVTVIGSEQLQRDAETNIADSLVQLPSVGVSETPSNGFHSGDFSQGDVALSVINLRNLGVQRNLVLFDGQRVVSSNIFGGGVDLSTIPTDLIKRVEVVTGGASAAYGSDAVSGVVNLILDKTFTGFKANLQGSDGTAVEHKQAKADLTWGDSFDGDRGHVILSGDYSTSPDAVFNEQTRGYNTNTLVQNPAATTTNGLPYYIHVRNSGTTVNTAGGLITGNTAGGAGGTATANSLKGIQFVGPNGEPTPFNYGTVNAASTGVCYNGCTNDQSTAPGADAIYAVPYRSVTLFGYSSYQVTPDIKASIQANYGYFTEENSGGNRTSVNTVYADNAYLPSSIASQFGTLSNGYNTATGVGGTAAQPTQTLSVGTNNTNNINLRNPTLSTVCSTLGIPCLTVNRTLWRGVATLEGALGSDWSWNVYAQHSEVREHQVAAQDTYGPRYNMAVDAVVVTPTNRGTSGLPLGSVQCRALLNPATAGAASGCAPLDIFGNGVASQAAITYVNPGLDPNSGILNQEIITSSQDVFSGSMQGVLPWELPAGKVAVAFGTEYRHEQAGIPYADPNGVNATWAAGNFRAYKGQYSVTEGFLETDVPILKDQVVENLNLNAAGRVTDYSTSGMVETWKLGLTSQVNDDIKLRGTWSLDIRAPLISDLFSPGILAISQLSYPTGTPTYQSTNAQGGNPALQPEKAITESVGAVLTPHWIEGLSLSVDYYNINIHGGIYTTDAQTVVNRCLQGENTYCNYLHFSPAQDGGVQPYQVDTYPQNAAVISTSGIDVSANYLMKLFDGTLNWALEGNYTDHFKQNAIDISYDQAGALGAAGTSLAYASSGLPKARATLSATYDEGPWSATVQGRFYGAAVLTNGVEALPANITRATLSPAGVLVAGVGNGNLIDDNNVDPVGYLDLRASYRFNENIQVYGAMDNVTNVPRPADGSNSVYDVLGRVIRAGVRFNY